MIIDTYSIGVNFKVDRSGLRSIESNLKRLERRASTIHLQTTKGGRVNNRSTKLRVDVDKKSIRSAELELERWNRKLRLSKKLDAMYFTSGAGKTVKGFNERQRQVNMGARNANQVRVGGFMGAGMSSINIGSANQALARLAVEAGGLGLAFAGLAGLARVIGDSIKVSASLESKMVDVNSILKGNSTKAQIKAVQDEVRRIGKYTIITAVEAGQGAVELARSGASAEQISGGGLAAAADLSIANRTSIAKAAKVVAKLVKQFNLPISEMSRVGDLLSGATISSTMDFENVRLAVGQAGGVVGALGVSIEDFMVTLAATSHAFTGGSDAATSLKVFFQRLTGLTGPAVNAMKDVGLIRGDQYTRFFDKSGNLKDMRSLFGIMETVMVESKLSDKEIDKLGDMTPDQVKKLLAGNKERSDYKLIYAMGKIFGQDAWRTGFAMGKTGVAGYDKVQGNVNRTTAKAMAADRLASYEGATKELASAWQDFQMTVMDQKALDYLADIKRSLADLVRMFSDIVVALKDSKLGEWFFDRQSSKPIPSVRIHDAVHSIDDQIIDARKKLAKGSSQNPVVQAERERLAAMNISIVRSVSDAMKPLSNLTIPDEAANYINNRAGGVNLMGEFGYNNKPPLQSNVTSTPIHVNVNMGDSPVTAGEVSRIEAGARTGTRKALEAGWKEFNMDKGKSMAAIGAGGA